MSAFLEKYIWYMYEKKIALRERNENAYLKFYSEYSKSKDQPRILNNIVLFIRLYEYIAIS